MKTVVVGAVVGLMAISTLTACSSASKSTTKASGHQLRVAVLVGGADNAYQAAGVTGIKEEAKKLNVAVTVFDGTFDSNKQYGQMQTVIGSGDYDAILINPVDGAGIVPLVQQAVAAHVIVGSWNQPIGTDLTTPQPTVDGVTAQVITPPAQSGFVGGGLVKKACKVAAVSVCQVAILNFKRGTTFDTAVDGGLYSAIKDDPSIKVVIHADTGATREGGLAAAQNILAGNPNINVMIGTSQSAVGALGAISNAKLSHKVYVIGQGLSIQGAQSIESGGLFGGTFLMPVDEGRLLLDQLVNAINKKPYEKAIDPVLFTKSICSNGVTLENVKNCVYQFNG